MKQTAVEWLMDQLSDNTCFISAMRPKAYKLFDEAIQMEKEQIKDAYCINRFTPTEPLLFMAKDEAEDYYKDTYGKEELA
jgi:Fe-S-cluster containining protein